MRLSWPRMRPIPLPRCRPTLAAGALRVSARAALGMLLGLALLAGPAAAQTGTKYLDLQSFYRTDLRALAVGNAFGAIARGESALLYNPAGLVQYKLDVKLDASLAIEGEAGDFYKDSIKQFTGSPSATDVSNYLSKYLGKQQNFRAETFVNGVANLAQFHMGLGAGALNQRRVSLLFADTVANGTPDIDVASPANPATNDTLVLSDQTLKMNLIAFGFSLFDGKLLTGVALKSFKFSDKSASDTFGNIVVSGNVDLTTTGPEYSGNAYDLGFIYRMEVLPFLRAQWSVVANNVGGITLQQTGFDTIKVPASYDVGFAVNPALPWSPVHLLISVEETDVSGAIPVSENLGSGVIVNHDRNPGQRFHAGAELGFWETSTGNHVLNLRVGKNRNGNTTGFELNLFSGMRILYTRYQDDFGWDGKPDKHSFQAAQVSLGFAF
jgi:hypothetical protein